MRPLVLLAAFAIPLIVACSSSHRNGAVADAGSDSGSDTDSGSDSGTDSGPNSDSGTCSFSTTTISIAARPTSTSSWSAEQCGASVLGTDFFNAVPTSVVTNGAINGVDVTLDRCPAADADCGCVYSLANVGTDVRLSGVLGSAVNGQLAPNALVLDRLNLCECAGCPCSVPVVLLVADAPTSAIPVDHSGVDIQPQTASCTVTNPDTTSQSRQRLAVLLAGISSVPVLTADEGESNTTEQGFNLRVVRSSEIECPFCGGRGPSSRAFIFWQDTPGAP